jgi:hypothetical protein
MTEFDYLMLKSVGVVSVGVVPRLDSVGDGMCCGYGDRSAAFSATLDDSNVLCTSGNSVPVMSATKSMRNVSYPE